MERYACRECGHHPAREVDRCECECHRKVVDLVEGGIRELRNIGAETSTKIQRFGAAVRLQSEAKSSLRRLTINERSA